MPATALQIAELRRKVAEPTTETYSDVTLAGYIEAYPLLDLNGEAPKIPGADAVHTVVFAAYQDSLDLVDNEDWIPTYDLNAAAADIWDEKAAAVAGNHDFSADGGSYSRSQVYEQYSKMAKKFRARRAAGTITMHPEPHKRLSGTL